MKRLSEPAYDPSLKGKDTGETQYFGKEASKGIQASFQRDFCEAVEESRDAIAKARSGTPSINWPMGC